MSKKIFKHSSNFYSKMPVWLKPSFFLTGFIFIVLFSLLIGNSIHSQVFESRNEMPMRETPMREIQELPKKLEQEVAPEFKFIFPRTDEKVKEIKGKVKNAISVEFYYQLEGASSPIYLGKAQLKGENFWEYSWNTNLTPNGQYQLFAKISNEFGEYESERIKIEIENEVSKEPKKEEELKKEHQEIKKEIEKVDEEIEKKKEIIGQEISEKVEPREVKEKLKEKLEQLKEKIKKESQREKEVKRVGEEKMNQEEKMKELKKELEKIKEIPKLELKPEAKIIKEEKEARLEAEKKELQMKKEEAETLKEELENFLTEQQKEYFFRIEISAKNLSNLIDDILEVARIEQGRLDFAPQAIQVSKVIEEVVGELKLKAEQKGLKLIFQPGEETSFIRANPNRLRQIIFNLIDNAIKYTFSGQIKIETKEDLPRKRYYIIIGDTGIGIPAEAQKRLFEKFYRVKTRETADIPGTGLGLWIARELTRKMDGEIFFESMEKVGTKFAIVFSLVKT